MASRGSHDSFFCEWTRLETDKLVGKLNWLASESGFNKFFLLTVCYRVFSDRADGF